MDDIRIERGVPTDSELAAIVGILLLRPPPAPSADPAEVANRWTASARPGHTYRDGRPARPGPGAWRASALP